MAAHGTCLAAALTLAAPGCAVQREGATTPAATTGATSVTTPATDANAQATPPAAPPPVASVDVTGQVGDKPFTGVDAIFAPRKLARLTVLMVVVTDAADACSKVGAAGDATNAVVMQLENLSGKPVVPNKYNAVDFSAQLLPDVIKADAAVNVSFQPGSGGTAENATLGAVTLTALDTQQATLSINAGTKAGSKITGDVTAVYCAALATDS